MRTVFDVKQVSLDPAVSTITLSGTADQIAVAEWLVPKLDVATGANVGPQKYFYGGNSNDVVYLAPLKNATQTTNLQEILTTLRTVADLQKIYQSTIPRILIMRSDPGHIAMAEFLTAQLDQPAASRQSAIIESFQPNLPGNFRDKNYGVIVYGLANTPSSRDLQVILTSLRTVLDIQKIYQYTPAKMLAIRADSTQIQAAEWLIPKLDAASSGSDIQMQMPGGNDDVVKVFYLPSRSANVNDLQASIRTIAKIKRMYSRALTTCPALVVRSTADQVAMAGTLISAN